MKITKDNYVEELIKIYTAVDELCHFQKLHPFKAFCLGRCNGKTRGAYLFLKYYTSINEAYSRAEKKITRPSVFRRLKFFIARNKIKKSASYGYTSDALYTDELHTAGADQNYEISIKATASERKEDDNG